MFYLDISYLIRIKQHGGCANLWDESKTRASFFCVLK
jgi:hypothetical protein